MLTMKQFLELERNADGRVVNLSSVFYLLKPKQVDLLHSDDWSYYYELVEEVEYELNAYR